jgi:hypothetical protein
VLLLVILQPAQSESTAADKTPLASPEQKQQRRVDGFLQIANKMQSRSPMINVWLFHKSSQKSNGEGNVWSSRPCNVQH